ncbi:hypothetical protein [Providencia sp. Me31A]|uniref:hypothetical protein n=1 Tax=Providencia sp. Me31A TaxID=3392637 RepID=UPI003D284537
MRIKLDKTWIGWCLIALFLMISSFLFGVSVTQKINFDPIEQTKINVSNLLDYPKAAEFKNMEYFYNKKTPNGGELGYICGEVFTFNRDILPDGFKRFIVKVYTPPKGLILLSFPIIEDAEDALLSEKIDSIWMMLCHN